MSAAQLAQERDEKMKKRSIRFAARFCGMLALLAALQLPAFAAESGRMLVPLGEAAGIRICADGVLVVGISQVPTGSGTVCPAAEAGLQPQEEELLALFREKKIEYVIAFNKADLLKTVPAAGENEIYVSALQGMNIPELRMLMAAKLKEPAVRKRLVGDLIDPQDMLVLVMPQDAAAPKGRLILPQVQMIRDILDEHAMALCVQTEELPAAIEALKDRPGLVITDSQVFRAADQGTPEDVLLTSFSILLARYKGLLDSAVRGVAAVETVTPEDTVLIVEGCTHHRQCEDIGTVKIPRGLSKHLGFDVKFATCSGTEYPEDLSPYKMVIHCGGCMLSEREVLYRVKCAEDQGVPITNYGILLAYLQGILPRALGIFPELQALIR